VRLPLPKLPPQQLPWSRQLLPRQVPPLQLQPRPVQQQVRLLEQQQEPPLVQPVEQQHLELVPEVLLLAEHLQVVDLLLVEDEAHLHLLVHLRQVRTAQSQMTAVEVFLLST
jgi:hypothetical protein